MPTDPEGLDVDLIGTAFPPTQHLDGGVTDSSFSGSCSCTNAEAVSRISSAVHACLRKSLLDLVHKFITSERGPALKSEKRSIALPSCHHVM